MTLQRRKAYNAPIYWTKEEEMKLLAYLKNNSVNESSLQGLFPNRTMPGIRSKIRKLRIKHDLFGASYRTEKENFTLRIAETVKPKIIFDAYAGAGHQTLKWVKTADIIYASEKMKSKLQQFIKTLEGEGFQQVKTHDYPWIEFHKGEKQIFFYNGDALDAAAYLRVENIKIDLIDLDTCGSTLPLIPTLLALIQPNHLVITHGEYHSLRFKREDVLRRILTHRDISQNPLPISIDDLSKELDRAVKTAGLRAHNEINDSFWLELIDETWLGSKNHGMLRRYYEVKKPEATSDCINEISRN